MQKSACASCKHQRKKCTDKCVLSPYFPAEKSREFKAVHKVFGVSNITKIVKSLKEDDRRRAVESLIWEAFCRQKDAILGSYGEYKRVHEELNLYKTQYHQQILVAGSNNNGMVYDATTQWNINTKRNLDNYINHDNSNLESWSSYNNNIINHVQNIEKLTTQNSNGSIVIVPQQQPYNQFNQQYFLTGRYSYNNNNNNQLLWT